MVHGKGKYRSRRNRTRITDLFWRDWDPIGVNHAQGAEGEYDRYADKAYVMLLDEGRSALEIADYLYFISSEYMGMGERRRLKDLALEVANKLVILRPILEAESDEPF